MMHNRDPVTPSELADNQRDGNPMPLSLSEEPIITDDHVAKMETLYQSMLAKAHSNIKLHVTA